jgi:uncharacterized protein
LGIVHLDIASGNLQAEMIARCSPSFQRPQYHDVVGGWVLGLAPKEVHIMGKASLGVVGWMDLTIPNADRVRDFYAAVVGWRADGVEMGGYQDWAMFAPGRSDPVAGICHAQGVNTGLPPCWLPYIPVADLDASLAEVRKTGGAVVSGPRDLGVWGRMAVIRDPAGAHVAIIQPPAPKSAQTKAKSQTAPRARPKPARRTAKSSSAGSRRAPATRPSRRSAR